MAVVYIKEQRAIVRKRGARLLVEKEGEQLAEIRLRETDSVAIFGSPQVTTQALSVLLEEGIPLAYFTIHGRLKGHLVPEASKNVPLRVAQYRAALDEGASLAAARLLVAGKIANTAAVVDSYRTNYPGPELAEDSRELAALGARALTVSGRDELLGIEGAAGARWFGAFARLNRSGLPFPGRRMRPAPDPVNALLSLGYTILGNELRALVEGAGLEPHLGFLHRVDYGRPSLALDLLEAFRAPVVDRMVLTMVNRGELRADDFARSVAGQQAGRVVLSPVSLARFVASYEAAMTRARRPAAEGIRIELQREVEKLKRWLAGGPPFEPWREEVEDVVPGEL